MAILLNIETATTVCSVSLSENNKLLAYKELNSGYTHAENLTVFIQDVLKEASLAINKIDAVAVSMGPGSYTGLRIGVSTAKGLCYALNKPLIAIILKNEESNLPSNLKLRETKVFIRKINKLIKVPFDNET